MALLSDCGGGGGGGGGGAPAGPPTFTVGGSVEGLDPPGAGTAVTLQNGTDFVLASGNGSFTFPVALANQASYVVSVVNSTFTLSLSVAGTLIDGVSFLAMPQNASYTLSQSIIDATANDTQANWCESTTIYGTDGSKGTPRASNSDCL